MGEDNRKPCDPFERLPTSIVPSHYSLHLTPDLVKCTFDGGVTINLEVKETSREIVLNTLDLEISHVELHFEDGITYKPSGVHSSVKNETTTIRFASLLPVGPCKITIKFTGVLNDDLKGFYRSKYTCNGEERWAAVTQFCACHTRRCFPCWDEPLLKATFDITLCVPQNRMALSNMPVASDEVQSDEMRVITFTRTPVMSTYLVAFVIGEFDHVEALSDCGVLVRVFTPVGKQEQGKFALNVAVKALSFYKGYFQIAYPLPKLDHVAIADFAAGAMENWGLIMYRETFILVDPVNSSTQRQEWSALTIAHEIAHQWFGNLVTMEWWTHIWLNEGYATFAEFLCVDSIFPEYDIWMQFVGEVHKSALLLDSLSNSHPIEVPVNHPSELDEIFDQISYNKGASVIRMLFSYIGDHEFRKGMNVYLTKFMYGNTCTADLWAVLEEVSKKPVSTIMPTWTQQMGYPVIKVDCEYVGDECKISLSQKKFVANCNSVSEGSSKGGKWMVPIDLITAKRPQKYSVVLEGEMTEMTVPGVKKSDWIKFNPGTVGFYRVQYPPELLANFLPAIHDRTLGPLDQLGLLDDVFALGRAGYSSGVEILSLLESMAQVDSYAVWSYIAGVLMELKILLEHAAEVFPLFLSFGRNILRDVSRTITWDPQPEDGHMKKLFRSLILHLLVSFEDEKTVIEAQRRFEAHLSGSNLLQPDTRRAVYHAVLKNADSALLDTFLTMYRNEVLQEEKARISQAFVAISDVTLLKKVLTFAMSDDVRSQSSLAMIQNISTSLIGQDLVWKFIQENWELLCSKFAGVLMLPGFVKSAVSNFASHGKVNEVEDFFKVKDVAGVDRSVKQAVEKIRINADWIDRDLSDITVFLQKYK